MPNFQLMVGIEIFTLAAISHSLHHNLNRILELAGTCLREQSELQIRSPVN